MPGDLWTPPGSSPEPEQVKSMAEYVAQVRERASDEAIARSFEEQAQHVAQVEMIRDALKMSQVEWNEDVEMGAVYALSTVLAIFRLMAANGMIPPAGFQMLTQQLERQESLMVEIGEFSGTSES